MHVDDVTLGQRSFARGVPVTILCCQSGHFLVGFPGDAPAVELPVHAELKVSSA